MSTAIWFWFLLQSSSRITSIDPNAILQSVRAGGARAIVQALYGDDQHWARLRRGVASGDSSWLRVAANLKGGADGGAASQLSLAVGEALEHQAATVLRIAPPTFEVSEICGGPDVDDSRYDSFERATAAVMRRTNRVRLVKDTRLVAIRDQCLKELAASRSGIAKFYGR
jgi:hypothetical protein